MRRLILVLVLIVIFANLDFVQAATVESEISAGNILTAGILDFSLDSSPFEPIASAINLEVGSTTRLSVDFNLADQSVALTYFASSTVVAGDPSFCQQLQVSGFLNGEAFGPSPLSDLKSEAVTKTDSSVADLWRFDFSLVQDEPNSLCSFNLDYRGRQSGGDVAAGGFSDTGTVSGTLYSAGLRFNRVGRDWIQLYNQTTTDLDSTDWQICLNDDCQNIHIPATTPTISAHGFVLVNRLISNGDHLNLRRPDGVVIDEMDWDGLNEAVGRSPNGWDTNQASDFIPLLPPTLTLINPDQSGTLVWYWGQTYDITWTALNSNGPDDDLRLDLSYIKDSDHSETITSADEIVVIEDDLANTGSYLWTVPSGFQGYTWISLRAFDEMSPALETEVISGRIYDPPPADFLLDPDQLKQIN